MKTLRNEAMNDREGGFPLRTLPPGGACTLERIPLRFLPVRENFSSRGGERVRFLVVHDTGNPAPTANAYNHYRYFNAGNRRASAHYFVDDREIVQIVRLTDAAWHVGDGRGKYGITNQNSVGIELCLRNGSDWEATKRHAQVLLRQLLSEYRLPKDRIVRHFDASRKICPAKMSGEDWKEWKEFLSQMER